jgi:hypothetical protein
MLEVLWVAGVSQLPAARYASMTSSLMRPRGETVTPLAAAHARTAALSTPLKDGLPVAAAGLTADTHAAWSLPLGAAS